MCRGVGEMLQNERGEFCDVVGAATLSEVGSSFAGMAGQSCVKLVQASVQPLHVTSCPTCLNSYLGTEHIGKEGRQIATWNMQPWALSPCSSAECRSSRLN
jgi:hypothetical protein